MTFFPLPSQRISEVQAILPQTSTPKQPHAHVLEALFCNLGFDLERLAATIDPILTAQSRCLQTSLYLQGIVVEDRAFLCTNLNPDHTIHVTDCRTPWRIGYGTHCALQVVHPSITNHHAQLSYFPAGRFFLSAPHPTAELSVNKRPLARDEVVLLQDGDLLELGTLKVEFFLNVFSAAHFGWLDDD